MGSSRARHHYDPHIISDSLGLKCYNAGYDGNGIILAYGLYNLIRDRYKPKVIVYDLTLGFDCYEYPEDQQDKRYISQLKPYYWHPSVQDIVKRISDEEYYKLFSGLLRYNCKTVNLAKEYIQTVPMYDLGYAPLKGQMDYEPTNYEEIPNDAPIDKVKLKFFEDFIKAVQRDSVELLMCISPRYKSSSKELYGAIESLCAEYNVTLFDFYENAAFSSNKDLFEDAAHLNRSGATLYTEMTICDVKNYFKKKTEL